MAATISGSWNSAVETEPNGTATIGSGSNRKLAMFTLYEQNSQRGSIVFTIDGDSYDEVIKYYETSTNLDCSIEAYIWNEATLGAMTGAAISYSDDSANTNFGWAYVTVQDCDQTDFSAFTGTHFKAGGSADQDVTTTSTADDYVAVLMRSSQAGGSIATWDTLSEVFDASTTGGLNAGGAGTGGDNTTTVAGDNTNERIYASLVFEAAAGGVTITDVDTDEAWNDGDTGLVITGTGFV